MDVGTVVTSIITAFVSTIVLQYLFAPWLEARKARKLKQAEAAADFTDKLHELAVLIWEVHNFHLGSGLSELWSKVQDLGILDAYQKLVLSKGNQRVAPYVIIIQQMLFATYSHVEDAKYLNSAVQVVRFVATAIDPATAPWSRTAARYRARRIYKMKVGPNLKAASGRPRPKPEEAEA